MGVSTPSRSNSTARTVRRGAVAHAERTVPTDAGVRMVTACEHAVGQADRPGASATSRSPTGRSTSGSRDALAAIKRHAAVGQRLARRARRRRRGRRGDRRRGPAGRGRRARRPVPDRRVPDRVGHVDEHERQRGAGRLVAEPRARPRRPPERPRQRVAVVERHRADGDPHRRGPPARRRRPPGGRGAGRRVPTTWPTASPTSSRPGGPT